MFLFLFHNFLKLESLLDLLTDGEKKKYKQIHFLIQQVAYFLKRNRDYEYLNYYSKYTQLSLLELLISFRQNQKLLRGVHNA